MLVILLLTCTLIWTLIISYQINRRGFLVLIIWLFIAPLTSSITQKIISEPLLQDQMMEEMKPRASVEKAFLSESKMRLKDFLEPTRILFGLFFLLFLTNALLKKNCLFNLNRIEVYMVLFSILLVINALSMSKRPMFGLHIACDAFIIPFLGYFLTRRLVTNEERFRKFIHVLEYMSLYVIIIALIERMIHQELIYRLAGPFPTANTLYAVLSVIFFVILTESYKEESVPMGSFISSPFLKKIVLYLTPIIIFLTLGRGNWLGFLFGLCVFIFMARKLAKVSTSVFMVGLMLLSICVVILIVPSFIPDDLVNKRIGNIPNIYARVGAWRLILNEGFSNPVYGIGIHNLRYLLATTNLAGWNSSMVNTAHNSFLAIASELGIIGLIIYAAVILSILSTGLVLYQRGAITQDKWRGAAIISILVAYLTPAMFANTLYLETPLHHVYAYAYAGAIAALDDRRRYVAEPWRMKLFTGVEGRRGRRSPVEIL